MSIFSGGHQFFRTRHVAELKREKPLLAQTGVGPYMATVELVPLSRGREVLFDVCARWVHPVKGSVGTSRIVKGLEPARSYFYELFDALHWPGPDDVDLRAAIGDAPGDDG